MVRVISAGTIFTNITLIQASISNHIPSKVWDAITYPFPNFKGWIVKIYEWISTFIPHFVIDPITYLCTLGLQLIHISKWGLRHLFCYLIFCRNQSYDDLACFDYRISQEICTRFCCALLCCGYAIVHNEFTWSIYPYPSGLLCWHWGNR